MNKKRAIAAGSAAAFSLLLGVPAFAATPSSAPSSTSIQGNYANAGFSEQKLTNAVFGTVSTSNGSSLTLLRKNHVGTSRVLVGISNATVFKVNGQPGVAAISPGQRVVVMGVKDTAGNIPQAASVNILTVS